MTPVRRRHVFYVSGFDPRGPGHYHRLYRTEAAKQSEVSGLALTVAEKRRQIDRVVHRWQVACTHHGEVTRTTYDFVRWDDVMREHWPAIGWQVMLRALGQALFVGLPYGYFRALKAIFPPFLLAVLQPVFWYLGLVAATLLAAGLAFAGASWAGAGPLAAGALAALPLLAAGLLVPPLNRRREQAGSTFFWRTRIGLFVRDQARDRVPLAEARSDDLADRIIAAAADPELDEVLVVGHSIGSHLVVSALARALARVPELGRGRSALSLLTLGQTTQMLSLMQEARRFRAELVAVGTSDRLTWVDFGAPGDAACFPRSDPLTSVGLARPPGTPMQPLALSPRFVRMFDETRYTEIKRDRMRMHFQYLMAADLPGPYDYFAITAGPLRLGERYPREDRRP